MPVLRSVPSTNTSLLGAVPASLGTALAMLVFVLGTLRSTGITDFSTNATDVRREVRSATHEARPQPAHLGTIAVELDTLHQLSHLGFAQTRLTAVLTFLGTVGAGID